MANLRLLSQTGQATVIELGAEPVVIGRSPECRIPLEDELISREHARIHMQEGGRFLIKDLGSRNKTYVNGQAISEILLVSGDVVRVGDHVLEYMDEGPQDRKLELDFLTPDRNEPAGCEWIKPRTSIQLTPEQLERLAILGVTSKTALRPEDVAELCLSQLLLDLGAERGFVGMKGEGKRDLKVIAQRGLRRTPGSSLTPVSEIFVFSTLLQKVAGRFPSRAGDFDPKSGFAQCAMVAPLTHEGSAIGLVYLDRPAEKRRAFTPEQLFHLTAAGSHIGALMAQCTRRLSQAVASEEAAWMASLRRVQSALLLAPDPSESLRIGLRQWPGRCRCGDLFAFFHLDPYRACVLMLDGGGSGMMGLMQAASMRTAIRSACRLSEDAFHDPAQLMNAVNLTAAAQSTRQSVPCLLVMLDFSTARLTYLNAGGPAPLIMGAPGRLITLDQPSLIPGVDPTYVYESTTVDLPDDFRLVAFSDGLVDAAGSSETFTEQRLHELLINRDSFKEAEGVAQVIADALKKHLGGAQPDDDVTILVVSRS